MIDFEVTPSRVLLQYEPEFSGASWVHEELKSHGEVTVSRAFTFQQCDLLSWPDIPDNEEDGDSAFRFHFADRKDGYFQIPGRILGIPNKILVSDRIQLERKLFVAERNVGIFRRLAKVSQGMAEIAIGGERENCIPIAVFRELLAKFPDTGELDRYASARVEAVVGEYFDGLKSARERYEAYVSKRKSSVSNASLDLGQLIQTEIEKFVYLRDTISGWLADASSYSERDWQKMFVKLILLIFPKYVAVLENVKIADYYSSPGRVRKRYIDICLVDAAGNLDVIEIKKPYDNAILSGNLYRDNSLPARELSGSIMQAEKYLFHLSKWGAEGEFELSKRYSDTLPNSMSVRVTNPRALIILGRDRLCATGKAASQNQLLDLEIIKRKYARVIDIITYDDLLRRLDSIIDSLQLRKVPPTDDGERRVGIDSLV